MNRDQCNLYINNISDKTNEDRLISYFSQFGTIESYTFLKKAYKRTSAAAIITYGLSVDIDYIIKCNHRMKFDNHILFLRRTLPSIRPAFERFMSSEELLISLDYLSYDEQFNAINIRKYFNKYGSIVSCRIIIPYTTYLIDFVETNSVDCAILDEPHYYNNNELILRKYISPNRIETFRTKHNSFHDNNNKKTKYCFLEKIRRLKHLTEANQFGQIIQLKLIKYSYEEKKNQFNKKHIDEIMKLIIQLRKICHNIKENIQEIKEKNCSLKLLIEQNQRIKKYIIDLYKKKIQNQQYQINELKKAIDALNFD